MRIILLTRSLESGGAERQLVVLANGLAARGHTVGVALFYARGPLRGDLAPRVRLHDLAKRGRWDMAGFLWRLVRLLRRERPEVLYSFLPVSNLMAGVAARLVRPRTRVVWGIRSAYIDHRRYDRLSGLSYALERLLSWLPDGIVANSEAGRREMAAKGFRENRVDVIFNGIDTERFAPVGFQADVHDRPLTIGLVGRLDPMKGHETLFKALVILRATHPPLQCLCVGNGDPAFESYLHERAIALGLGNVVTWLPAQSDVVPIYRTLDVLVSASEGEGFPNVIAEAMACELPCVATDVGDSALILGDPRWVVRTSDPASLADAVRRLIDLSPEERGALGAVNRRRIIEQFSVAHMVEATEAVLRQCVGRSATP